MKIINGYHMIIFDNFVALFNDNLNEIRRVILAVRDQHGGKMPMTIFFANKLSNKVSLDVPRDRICFVNAAVLEHDVRRHKTYKNTRFVKITEEQALEDLDYCINDCESKLPLLSMASPECIWYNMLHGEVYKKYINSHYAPLEYVYIKNMQ